jgi:hypothetical protein
MVEARETWEISIPSLTHSLAARKNRYKTAVFMDMARNMNSPLLFPANIISFTPSMREREREPLIFIHQDEEESTQQAASSSNISWPW